MRTIRIVCVGKTQEPYLIEGIRQYEKKLKRFCRLSWMFTKEVPYQKRNANAWRETDQKNLAKNLQSSSFTIACDEKGKSFTSKQLADCLQTTANSGISQIDFIIGGPFGLPESIVRSADLVLSLSQMTFTHQMVRLILIEQIYRAFSILHNTPYHHSG